MVGSTVTSIKKLPYSIQVYDIERIYVVQYSMTYKCTIQISINVRILFTLSCAWVCVAFELLNCSSNVRLVWMPKHTAAYKSLFSLYIYLKTACDTGYDDGLKINGFTFLPIQHRCFYRYLCHTHGRTNASILGKYVIRLCMEKHNSACNSFNIDNIPLVYAILNDPMWCASVSIHLCPIFRMEYVLHDYQSACIGIPIPKVNIEAQGRTWHVHNKDCLPSNSPFDL